MLKTRIIRYKSKIIFKWISSRDLKGCNPFIRYPNERMNGASARELIDERYLLIDIPKDRVITAKTKVIAAKSVRAECPNITRTEYFLNNL